MLFSVAPKSSRAELFDFEEELGELIRSISINPITVIIGLRRTGKTSLLKVALNECGYPYIYIDPRFSAAPSYIDFSYLLKSSLEDFLRRNRDIYRKIIEFLKGVKGLEISIPSLSVEISWRGREKIEIGELFLAMNNLGEDLGKPIVIAIDEAQELKKMPWISFDRLFAYIYDNLNRVRIVLTGSEVGLLYKFLRVDDPDAPLYGRYIHVVKTRKLSYEESLKLLKRGFRELGVEVSESILSKAIESFDGVIGWLVLFGYTCYMNIQLCLESMERIVDVAVEVAKQELENFLSTRRSRRYRTILKILTGERRWSEVKKMLELEEGRTINDRTLNELLQTLIDLSLVERNNDRYVVADPVMRKAIERL